MSSELIDIEYLKKVDLRIGIVRKAERVPGSKKLLRLEVDLGNEVRQIVAGLAPWYQPEELVGKRIVVVANLKPKKLMGLESQGMLLAAVGRDGKPYPLTVEGDVEAGAKVF